MAQGFPSIRKSPVSQSLYEIPESHSRIYIRYSKVHDNGTAFYGFRASDLRWLEGFRSTLCLLWDGQVEPLIIPYAAFEDVFGCIQPSSDGQYKVVVHLSPDNLEMSIPNAGRFNVQGYLGWSELSVPISANSEILPKQQILHGIHD